VLISSSAGEGWPNVVGESMACGTPVVSTNVGEAEHIIGDSGITIETMDASALADGALEIISLDPPSYRELSGRARARICENFDIEKIAEQYHTAYVQAENRFRK
jgi:glycosyltransferase involved in cell wall biosynthesis